MSAEPQETTEEGRITNEQAEIYNRKACEMVSIFFQEIATISADEIYDIASKGREQDSVILLEAINRVFTRFLENGEGLPRIYFDSYIRTVTQTVDTFKLNIENKLEQNTELVLRQVTEKDSKDMSYTDIAKSILVQKVEEEVEAEVEEEVATDVAPPVDPDAE